MPPSTRAPDSGTRSPSTLSPCSESATAGGHAESRVVRSCAPTATRTEPGGHSQCPGPASWDQLTLVTVVTVNTGVKHTADGENARETVIVPPEPK